MSPLKNNRFGSCDWMPARIAPNAWGFCTHSLSCGRMVPVRLGTPPWVVGFGFASKVVASGLPGSVRLSPTVAKLKTTGAEACALATPVTDLATIEAAHAAYARRKARFDMNSPSLFCRVLSVCTAGTQRNQGEGSGKI